MRKCGRSVNREVSDRGSGMRLTERTRKMIPMPPVYATIHASCFFRHDVGQALRNVCFCDIMHFLSKIVIIRDIVLKPTD